MEPKDKSVVHIGDCVDSSARSDLPTEIEQQETQQPQPAANALVVEEGAEESKPAKSSQNDLMEEEKSEEIDTVQSDLTSESHGMLEEKFQMLSQQAKLIGNENKKTADHRVSSSGSQKKLPRVATLATKTSKHSPDTAFKPSSTPRKHAVTTGLPRVATLPSKKKPDPVVAAAAVKPARVKATTTSTTTLPWVATGATHQHKPTAAVKGGEHHESRRPVCDKKLTGLPRVATIPTPSAKKAVSDAGATTTQAATAAAAALSFPEWPPSRIPRECFPDTKANPPPPPPPPPQRRQRREESSSTLRSQKPIHTTICDTRLVQRPKLSWLLRRPEREISS